MSPSVPAPGYRRAGPERTAPSRGRPGGDGDLSPTGNASVSAPLPPPRGCARGGCRAGSCGARDRRGHGPPRLRDDTSSGSGFPLAWRGLASAAVGSGREGGLGLSHALGTAKLPVALLLGVLPPISADKVS